VVVDVDGGRAAAMASRYGTRSTVDLGAALECDAVILSTPTQVHVPSALAIIEAGVPILIEKPVALELGDVDQICAAARTGGVALACGFVERFNPVITLAMKLLEEPPIHVLGMRHSPTDPRNVGSVVHDLLIHDLDLTLLLFGADAVERVSGGSWSTPGNDDPEIADCTIQFASGALATLSASRVGQRKLRSIQVLTSSMLLDLDLLRADVTVYRNVRQEQPEVTVAPTYRAETIVDIPFVRHAGEPLALELDHFLDLCEGRGDQSAEIDRITASHALADQVSERCNPRVPSGGRQMEL
jgi:predicted dehydrogenase